jgi:penicillin-binding protein 1A
VTRFILSFLGGLFSWVVTALLVGGLVLAGVFWVYSRDLPDYEALASYTPKTISRIYSGEGQLMDEFATERRMFAPIDEIPDLVKHAFISAEDKNFYTHKGFDARGMVAAAVEAVRSRGKNLRGASTIPQQVAKNFLLSGDRTVERKIKEVILSTRLVGALSKDKILELYLNEIDLGFQSFGVASAAQTYFNKTLAELKPEEAAYLAALPKAPYSYHPVKQKEAAVARRNYVLNEMYQNGYLTKEEHDAAVAVPLKTVQNGDYPSFKGSLPPRDYFTDEIRRQLSKSFGQEEFFGGGFRR